MARDFSKDLANYMSLGNGAIAPLINGASAISIGMFVNYDSVSGLAGDDGLFSCNIQSSIIGIRININGAASNCIRVSARSQSADGTQTVNGTLPTSPGTTYHVGTVLDFAGDTITIYLNGVPDTLQSVTFGASVFTAGGSYSTADILGGLAIPPAATGAQLDGRLSEIVLYSGNIGSSGFGRLANCVSPLNIEPGLLEFYMRLLGDVSPEPNIVGGQFGTITGSVPQGAHPCVFTLPTVSGAPLRSRRHTWAYNG